MDPTKLAFEAMQGIKDSDTGKKKLYRKLGTTPTDQTVAAINCLTPKQRQTLEYMSKIRDLTPDVKEVKRASLPASRKFLGDMDKFDDFKEAVEGHYCQQQAS